MKLDFHRMGQKLAPAIMARYLQAACDADDAAHGYAPLGGAGGFPPSVPPAPALFERSPYIELSFDSRQLKAIRRYIRLNPARKLWRLLILSGFSQTPALSGVEMRKNPEVAHAFRRNCLAMNDLAAALCAAAQVQQ